MLMGKNSINKRAGFPRNSAGQATPQFTPQFCGAIQDFDPSWLVGKNSLFFYDLSGVKVQNDMLIKKLHRCGAFLEIMYFVWII